ncbi:glycosyl transferase family 1 [Gemmatimonadetes bacterium T265]|nr:glycosyl transferase family 1 [Gemmatimonadetes bacterium T265]
MGAQRWAIITVEYPPQLGGVADYTHAVATGLAASGDEVHVWAPPAAGVTPSSPGVTVHRLPGRYGPRALAALDRELADLRQPYRLLVQYVPQGFGGKGMNLLFPLWLRHRHADRPWVMFHEVALTPSEMRGAHRWAQAHVTRFMARLTRGAASRTFVSIPAWATMLDAVSHEQRSADWLPVPSTVPTMVGPHEVRNVRDQFVASGEGLLVGHFGVAGHAGGMKVAGALAGILAGHPDCSTLLVGRRSDELGARMRRAHPAVADRLHVAGTLPLEEVAAHLAACDLLIQPYPDGVSSRRTSLLAGLALGVPIVTVDGRLTESLWRDSGAVALAPDDSAAALLGVAEQLLSDAAARERIGLAGAALYERRFALSHTLAALRSSPATTARVLHVAPPHAPASAGAHL